jgi:putative heme transporter
VIEQREPDGSVVDTAAARSGTRWSPLRVALLLVSAVCLYLLAPRIEEVLSAWDRLGEVHTAWLVPALLCGLGSFACVWVVQAVALSTRRWFVVITTQLAGNAFNRVTPGGGATGTALQVSMLMSAGFDGAHAGTALTVQSALSTASLVTLPLFSLPFVAAGTAIPNGLLPALWIGLPVFVVMLAIGLAVFVVDGPLCWIGRTIGRVRRRLRRRRGAADPDSFEDLGERLLESRDAIRASMGPRWQIVVGLSVLRWLLEYGVLLAALYGLSAHPEPALTLLAFTAASVLGLLPFTPGGLGFVEAGLTATLNLAGVRAGDALVATLVYRLVVFWLPLPIGALAGFLFRRRYPRVRGAPGSAGITKGASASPD